MLVPGVNTITRDYTDASGNVTTIIHTVTLDPKFRRSDTKVSEPAAPTPAADTFTKGFKAVVVHLTDENAQKALVAKETRSKELTAASPPISPKDRSTLRKYMIIYYDRIKKEMAQALKFPKARVSLESKTPKPASETPGQKLKKMFVVIKAKLKDLVDLAREQEKPAVSVPLVSLEKGAAALSGSSTKDPVALKVSKSSLLEVTETRTPEPGESSPPAASEVLIKKKQQDRRPRKPISSASSLVSDERHARSSQPVESSGLQFSRTSIRIPDEFGGITATTDNYKTGKRTVIRRDRNGAEISRQTTPLPESAK